MYGFSRDASSDAVRKNDLGKESKKPNMSTINLDKKLFSEMLKYAAETYGDKPAVTCGETTLSFKELRDAVDLCALKLVKAGAKKGDRVVLWGFNDIEWTISFYGIIGAGGVAVLMNYGLKQDEVAGLTKMVQASFAIIGGNTISIKDPNEAAKAVILGGVPADHIFPHKAFAFDASAEITGEMRAMAQQAAAAVDPKDSQVIIYTTGTTSLPKAVQLSSYSTLSDAEGAIALIGDEIGASLCLALPMFHSYGLTVLQCYLSLGSHVYLSPLLKPDVLRDMIAGYGIDDMTSVGAIYGMLTRLPDFEEKIAGQLRICIVGGGFTTPVEMMRLEKMFRGAKILCGYGQTECSPIISVETCEDPLERRAISVGHVLPNLDVRIWNESTGFVENGGIGEILVKGPIVTNGYFGLPEDKQPFDKDGWLHTGDLGKYGEDGMLQFAGRIKDIIIRSGENISPVEIEKAMLLDPAVREVKVLGAPHPIWGESVEACVVMNGGQEFNEEETRVKLRNRIAPFKIPSHFFVYPAFPLNENGKLDQRGLKADMLGRLREIAVAQALDAGLRVLDLKVKNRNYTIVPACSMVEELAAQLGFDHARAERIRLSVEEMLTDRIDHAYDDSGEIRMEVVLMPDWLQLRFTDNGKAYRLDSDEATISAKIILANIDAYSSGTTETGESEYSLDYQYSENFNVKAYLLRHGGATA